MTALELLKALHASGTGTDKLEAARAACRAKGLPLAKMDGRQLLMLMARAWPEGTTAKAYRILSGQPADPPKQASGPSDWDAWAAEEEAEAEAFKRAGPPEAPGEDGLYEGGTDADGARVRRAVPTGGEVPPGIRESPGEEIPSSPGVRRNEGGNGPQRKAPPRKRPPEGHEAPPRLPDPPE